MANSDPGPFQGMEQGVDDIGGLVRARKNASPPFGFQGDAQAFKVFHHRRGREPGHRTVKEAAVPGHVVQNALRRGVVGEIAPAFAGDIELAAQFLVGLQQQDLSAALPGGEGSHHSGRAAAHYDHRGH